MVAAKVSQTDSLTDVIDTSKQLVATDKMSR